MQEDLESNEDKEETAVRSEGPFCRVCKEPFTRKTKKGIYCSPKCRQAAFFDRRDSYVEIFEQIKKKFKKETKDNDNKISLHRKIDDLIVKWKKEFGALADEANGYGRNRSQRLD